jgi:hypothetical protein
MSSNVDTTFPADNEKVSKASWRAQQLVIKTELEELQRKTRLPWLIARGDQTSV